MGPAASIWPGSTIAPPFVTGGSPPEAALARALADRDPRRELVLLAHQPRTLLDAEPFDVGLQISGHTHGGQMWPFNFVVQLQQPFVAGLHRRGRAQIYVSRGTGYWGPPMRLGAPAEITEIRLECAPGTAAGTAPARSGRSPIDSRATRSLPSPNVADRHRRADLRLADELDQVGGGRDVAVIDRGDDVPRPQTGACRGSVLPDLTHQRPARRRRRASGARRARDPAGREPRRRCRDGLRARR